MKKKVAIRAALLVAIFAGVFGLADALNLPSGTLGAADTVVAACQTATMNATYTVAYSASQPGYQATSVVVTGLATTCWNKPYKVTLGGAAGARPDMRRNERGHLQDNGQGRSPPHREHRATA